MWGRFLIAGLAWMGTMAATAWAETPAYDLATCLRTALANSPDLEAAAAELAGARAQISQAQAGRYGQAEYTQLLGLVNGAEGNAVVSNTNKNDFFKNLGAFTRFDLLVNIPLWTFGKLDAALRAAQEGMESQAANAERRRAEVIFGTKQLYYSLLLTRQLSAILHDMQDNMDKAVRKSEQRLQAGSAAVSELDVLKLKVGRSKFAKGVYEVDAAMELTRAALARAIGVPVTPEFDIRDRRLEAVAANLDPLDDYLAQALVQRPEARQLQTGIAAQSAKVDLEEASYYPMVFLSTGLQFARAGNRTEQKSPFANDEFNYVRPVGVLGMRWDLNFLETSAKVDEARADLHRLQALQRDATTGMQLEIRKTYGEVAQARETIKAAEEGRKAGRGLLILSVSNFDLGIGEAEELFKGLGMYTETSTDYMRAVHDYNVAVAALSKAVGKELTSLEY